MAASPVASEVCYCLAACLLLGLPATAQTRCATDHTASGAFICYPNPAVNEADSHLPAIFHFSAAARATPGRTITGYRVMIDNVVVSQSTLPVALQELSIETNLKSRLPSGPHALRLVIPGAGSAEVKGLQFDASKNVGFCDPFSRFDPRSCSPSDGGNTFEWSPTESAGEKADGFRRFSKYLNLYSRNFESIEADSSDAAAVDAHGNLYVASHAFADIDLRKYTPNGSLVYSSLIRSCGGRFLSVAGLVVDNNGRAWLAGSTDACLPTTPNAMARAGAKGVTRGFVMLVDTTTVSPKPPLYLTYLSDVYSRIAAIRVDSGGNAYIAGTTTSSKFPHETSLNANDHADPSRAAVIGFVSVLNPAGTALLWSTLLPNTQLRDLALDGNANVYVTGSVSHSGTPAPSPGRQTCTSGCNDVFIAQITEHGRHVSYAARLGGAGDEEGRAISVSHGDLVFIAGETDSQSVPARQQARDRGQAGRPQPFLLALQACGKGVLYSRILTDINAAPEVALRPALDAFTSDVLEAALPQSETPVVLPFASLQNSIPCPSGTP